ncbi:MAG: GWxTD domain-containing protein [Gemmatimonadaceae bacterium]
MPTIRVRDAAVTIAMITCATAQISHAQIKPDSAKLRQTVSTDVALQADYLANAGDSLAAYKMLDSAVQVNKRDAAAWHRYGMMAWSMARSSRGNFINSSPQGIRWLLAADSAMHFAVTFAPESASYWRDLARFYLNSGSVFVRLRAQDYVTKGLKSAEKAGDKLLIAELSDERGMILWRRYETTAHGELPSLNAPTGGMFNKDQAKYGVGIRRDQLDEPKLHFTGFADYTDALEMFQHALAANAQNARARLHVYMALAERNNWLELLAFSSKQTANAPWDFQAWAAVGLAQQRLNHSDAAAAAFDSALAMMTPIARGEYTRVTRILPPKSYGENRATDSTDFVKQSATQQQFTENMFWSVIDPLAATATNELRTEFYARVTYSDLRWTSDDLDHRGADSDRGEVHIRMGPPDLIVGSTWRYNSGFSITFSEPPTFGTGRIVFDQRSPFDTLLRVNPVRWDNVPVMKLTENMNIRTTAFRSANDSMDVVAAADVPTRHLAAQVDLAGALPFTMSSRVVDAHVQTHAVQSLVKKFNADSIPQTSSQSWVSRVGPGPNLIRVEAYQPDTRRIARGFATVDDARSSTFGMSDVLIGNRPLDSSSPTRWSDVNMTPSAGVYHVGDPISLVWENYELKPDGADVKYRVHITVEPVVGSGLQNLSARIRSAFGNNELGRAIGQGTVEIDFPRAVPAHAITVEALTVDLGKVIPGNYRITVELTDLVTKLKTERSLEIRVVE